VEQNHNTGLIWSNTGDAGEFTTSNMTSLTSPSDEILEMLQNLVKAVRNLSGCVYWGYNLTQYGVIKEVRGGNGLNLAIFDDQEKTQTFGSFSDMGHFSCKVQSRFELINQVSPIYSHNIDNQLNVIQQKQVCFFFQKDEIPNTQNSVSMWVLHCSNWSHGIKLKILSYGDCLYRIYLKQDQNQILFIFFYFYFIFHFLANLETEFFT
jgi:hypothetical protein